MLFDYIFAVACPECKDSVFNLYEWQLDYRVCLKCAWNSLQLMPGSIQCQECKKFTIVEKSENLLVEKNNKRVCIQNDFLYCSHCEAEGTTKHQLYMKKYRLALALRNYKKTKKEQLPPKSIKRQPPPSTS